MLSLDASALERLEEYAASFTEDFRRRDQARWLNVYLRGLLTQCGRKNTQSLARWVTLPTDSKVEDLAQALQNFVNQSPWEETRLWRRYRSWIASRWGDQPGVLVVADVAFPKQGQRSVGVLRQLEGGSGKKINCQLAVSVSLVGQTACFPLGLRLYLPRSWIADPNRLAAVGVPPEHQAGASKRQIALELLDELRAEGFPERAVVANALYGSSHQFRDDLRERGWPYLVGVGAESRAPTHCHAAGVPLRGDLSSTRASRSSPVRDLIGPDHLVAYPDYLASFGWLRVWMDDGTSDGATRTDDPNQLLVEQRPDGSQTFAVGNLSAAEDGLTALRMWNALRVVEESFTRMKEDLGLNHFEGRSWRGFHHHACLVALAHGFLTMEEGCIHPEREVCTC